MDKLITTKLREDCLKLRDLANNPSTTSADLGAAKEKMLKEIHLILTLMLGPRKYFINF
jgi:bleomycin hydrolase